MWRKSEGGRLRHRAKESSFLLLLDHLEMAEGQGTEKDLAPLFNYASYKYTTRKKFQSIDYVCYYATHMLQIKTL